MNAVTRFTGCTLMELRPNSCRWPISERTSKGYLFCGCKKAHKDVPYCAEHMARAVNPAILPTPKLPSLIGYTVKPYDNVALHGERYGGPKLRGTLTARLEGLGMVVRIGRRDVMTMSVDELRQEARAIDNHRDSLHFDSEWVSGRLAAITTELRKRGSHIES